MRDEEKSTSGPQLKRKSKEDILNVSKFIWIKTFIKIARQYNRKAATYKVMRCYRVTGSRNLKGAINKDLEMK